MSGSLGTRASWGARVRTPFTLRAALLRAMSVLIAVMVVLIGQVIMGDHGVAAGQAATINIDGASLFAADDASSAYLGTMYAGDRVDVLWGPENGMYQIRYYGTDGWTWAANLTLDVDQCCAPVSGSGGAEVWISTDYLNVRADASLAASVYEVAPTGTEFTTAGDEVNGFVPVYYGDGVAWLWGGYLSWNGPVAAAVGGDSGGGATAAPEHWIDVNRSSGAVTLMIGDQAQATYWGSMGFDQSSAGFYSTAIGTYYVYSKYEPLSYTPFANAYITDWVGFDPDRQNGFHSYTKDANGNIVPGGAGATGGCIALPPGAIQDVYNFSFIGMRVSIHW